MEKFILLTTVTILVILGLTPARTLLKTSETPTVVVTTVEFQEINISYITHDVLVGIKATDYSKDSNEMFYEMFPEARFVKLTSKELKEYGYFGYIVRYGSQMQAVMKKKNESWLIIYSFEPLNSDLTTETIEIIMFESIFKWRMPLNS